MSKSEERLLLKSICGEVVKDTFLEAKDSYGNWYPVKVLKVDKSRVHVHFCDWSSRYDSWYPINSKCLRAVKKDFTKDTAKLVKPYPFNCSMNKSPETSASHFDVGSYVMAAWRNDFEYLAEVLAHRQRHGTRAEYRLRYIWDRVVEWTPVNKLRKATQYEIDYVLKFCKEQGSLPANKIPNKFDLQHSCSSSSSSSSEYISGIPRAKRIRTTLSESRSTDHALDSEIPKYRSRPTRASTNSSSVLEDKKILHPTLYDGIIEQDGMVYDKIVFQFHEACRRRRELKRKAIEENEMYLYGFDGSVSALGQTSSERSNHQTRRDPNLLNSPKSSSVRAENYTTENTVTPPLGSPISSSQKSDEIKETKLLEKASHLSNSSLNLSESSKCDERPRRTIVYKREAEIKISSMPISREIFTKVPAKSAAPVVYPCPHCSRQLRNSKLLDAHIVNYHKSVSGSTKSTTHTKKEIYQNRYLPWKSHMQLSSLGPMSKEKPRSSAPEFTRLLSCHCCNARAYATEKELGLIQCSHCLCWFHRLCGGTSFDSKLFSNVDLLSNNELCSPVVCNNCRMVLRPARRSRKNEWRTGLLRSHDLNSEFSKRGLLTDVSSILNKACQLRPLLASGWQILNRSNLPSVSDQVKQDSGVFKNAYQDASKPSEFPTSKFAGSIKHTAPVIHTPEDQVNRLYMELRGIAFGNLSEANGEITASKCDHLQLPNDNHTFCISTPDSECPNTNWPLDEAINGSAQSESVSYQVTDPTYHIASQDLSGFLQDLGPDIIPEISGFNVDGVINISSVTADSCSVDEFLKVPRSYPEQPPVSQNNDKLCRENTALQLLCSHPRITNTSVKDLGTILDISASEDSTLSPLKYFSNTVCNNHLESGQQLLSCDSNIPSTSSPDKPMIQTSVDVKINRSNIDGGISVNESSDRISTNHLGTGVGSDIINLSIPKCARSIISDLLSSPLNDFVTPCVSQQSDLKGSNILHTSCTSNEFVHLSSTSGLNSLDIDWLEADSHNQSVNSSTSPVYQNNVKIYDHSTLNEFSDLANHITNLSNMTFHFSVEQLRKLAQTQDNLLNVDECILTPFENALSVMEAQLDVITTHVTNFEQLQKYDHNNMNTECGYLEDEKVPSYTKHQGTNQVLTPRGPLNLSQSSNGVHATFSWGKMNDKASFPFVLEGAKHKEYKIDLETYLESAKTAAQYLYRLQKVSLQESNLHTDVPNVLND
ncbi:hypothetical protein MS3_00003426 [Schistosoma haematobium]|uniref:C2H2-type domain-containing protein n=1 Tax=Schistosoma haematobium TaxID=6185 RepID=A0A922LPH6_SCHHA|nr:hypothetical protein MS3_00003426 [Schistosoma haematobium]KAH9590956.1 hypothetical protein MS3_00003426 [Schistosoma haematobium]CAH8664059.1 unnamed protein product [Schistosoma haematobium]CAH8671485.1 unnamed protein product [Schistosoma haematobium]